MKEPKRLHPGDTVAAISLSWGGAGTFPLRYQQGKRQLEKTFGVKVVETRHALRDPQWLHENPEARAADLMEAFSDPSIDAIISTIGGDDSIRILPFLDLSVIAGNPKIFLGYSDTTVTHLACFKAGLVSFYGTSLLTGFAENCGIFPYTERYLRAALFSSEPIGVLLPNRDGWTSEFLEWGDAEERKRTMEPATGWRFIQGSGMAEGRLVGGCLEVLDWLRGTSVWPDDSVWEGAILFLETSEEAPSPTAVTRMVRSLGALGILHKLAGMLVGRPGVMIDYGDHSHFDQEAIKRIEEGHDREVLEVVVNELGLTDLPIVTNMDFGHTDPTFVLPYGVMARIDCDQRRVEIIEACTVD